MTFREAGASKLFLSCLEVSGVRGDVHTFSNGLKKFSEISIIFQIFSSEVSENSSMSNRTRENR